VIFPPVAMSARRIGAGRGPLGSGYRGAVGPRATPQPHSSPRCASPAERLDPGLVLGRFVREPRGEDLLVVVGAGGLNSGHEGG
jgi:hypothetical protein